MEEFISAKQLVVERIYKLSSQIIPIHQAELW